MDEILNTIGATIGDFFANPIVELAIQSIAVYWCILWLAAAYWAFRDMQLRSENPILPYLAAALIILFTPVLFVFGIVVYRIVRPQEKIAEVYERNLAEEALLAEVEAIKSCPGCRRRINEEWIICPSCRTRLNRVCANCGRLVGLDWSLCAWCGKDFERTDVASYDPIATEMPQSVEAPAGGAQVIRGAARSTSLRGTPMAPPQNPSSPPGSSPEPCPTRHPRAPGTAARSSPSTSRATSGPPRSLPSRR